MAQRWWQKLTNPPRLSRKTPPRSSRSRRKRSPLALNRLEDRTLLSTTMVADINHDAVGNSPYGIMSMGGGNVFFQSSNYSSPFHNTDLYFSNGTTATQLTTNLYVSYQATLNGKLYFIGSDSLSGNSSPALYVSDGTVAGTSVVKPFGTGTNGATINGLTVVGSNLMFEVQSSVNGAADYALWKSDGTAAGTSEVYDYGTAYFNYYGPTAWLPALLHRHHDNRHIRLRHQRRYANAGPGPRGERAHQWLHGRRGQPDDVPRDLHNQWRG
jgi:ELWxxDGT repeat protein